ncbi:hypothetical protein SAMN06295909_0108 [Plantibacter sp. VKM Ac-1784]|uniref:Uncharacterized protein n=1 Tax=Plantibacter elymi (nom. nud.) TaxID=199708 RepID=A0ABY1R832_9MICO|nr:hypothetical protein [Plantibacter sp. VKM Ac-1784]SMQ58124.1 hypothetical protein SAMN06295909_0108 [Plantibacter sp. VKM Ac-1784]
MQSSLDAYAIKARWLPVAVAVFPIALLTFAVLQLDLGLLTATPGAAAAILMVPAAEIVRSRGLACERRLIEIWDGLPTTRALRWRNADGRTHRRREAVEARTGHRLPSADEESDGAASDLRYADATRTAISMIRADGRDAPVLQAENASYGMRRNFRGLKPFGILLAAISIVGSVAAWLFLQPDPAALLPAFLIQSTILGFWMVYVKDSWVAEQADTFSDRFFTVLDAQSTSAAR